MELHNKVTIMQINVRGWASNKYSIGNVVNNLGIDVVLINEHGIRGCQSLRLYNYRVYRSNRLDERSSGTAIAIRDSLVHRLVGDFESDLLAVKIETSIGPIVLATDYIPHRVGYLQYIDYYRLMGMQLPVYMLGDLNGRSSTLGYRDTNTVGRQIDILIDRGHVRHLGPHFPTFITNRCSTTPDIILGNSHIYHNIHMEAGPPTTSDHIPIIFTINSSPIQIPTKERFSYKRANWEAYREHFREQNIGIIDNVGELDWETGEWTREIIEGANLHIPKVRYRTIPGAKSNRDIDRIKGLYREIHRIIRVKGSNRARKGMLDRCRNLLGEEYRKQHRENWDKLIDKVGQQNPEEFWQSIGRIYGKREYKGVQHLRDHNNNMIVEDRDKEELFRGHWEKVFRISEEENEDFDRENEDRIDSLIEDNIGLTRSLGTIDNYSIRIDRGEIIRVIKSFKHRAPGQDGITKHQLANLPRVMLDRLKNILEACINLGHIPNSWKSATMIFLPKPDKSPTQHTNYRPISLLNLPSKILEKIINNRMLDVIEGMGLNNRSQHGFRKGRGTDTGTALIYELIAVGRANQMRVNVVLRDIKGAFDKVWHRGLIGKMMENHFPTYLVRVISNYLEGRTARIRIGEYLGTEFGLSSGVPQGGCLSPQLFAFYTHDIPEGDGQSENIIYADDITQIVRYRGTENMLTRATERQVGKINDYERKWKIRTNMGKFKIIAVGGRRSKRVKLGGGEVEYSSDGKALGLRISSTGFVGHISDRIDKAKGQLRKLFMVRDLPQKQRRLLYLTTVRSTLLYPTVPLHVASNQQLGRLEVIQNKGARIVTRTRLLEGKTNEEVGRLAGLEPIREYLDRQAGNLWGKIEIDGELERKLTLVDDRENYLFRSSRKKALG